MKRKDLWAIFFLLLLSNALLTSCLPNSSTSRRVSLFSANSDASNDENQIAPTPTNLKDIAFLQANSSETTAQLKIYKDFRDIIFLRGKPVHNYFATLANRTVNHCLVIPYKNVDGGKLLIVPATFNMSYNSSSKDQEYFFQILMVDESVNKALCEKSSLVQNLTTLYPSYDLVYGLEKMCTESCPLESLSDPLMMFNDSGLKISSFSISNLSIVFINVNQTVYTGATCYDTPTCKGLGSYDCCLNGQCVKDKAVRNGADTSSSEFIAAQEAISLNPNDIYDYPEFYYLCPSYVAPDPSSDKLPYEASPEFILKQELYQCTIPTVGEMSICTLSYDNAQNLVTAQTIFSAASDDRNFSLTYMGTNLTTLGPYTIDEIIYGGVTIYDKVANVNPNPLSVEFVTGTDNDDLTSAQLIKIKASYPNKPLDNKLKIKYQIDGSCEEVNSELSRCYKIYIQGKDIGSTIDHPINSKKYNLPLYADLTLPISVSVDGYITQEGIHYNKVSSSTPSYIEFIDYNSSNQSGITIYNSQEVKITYYSRDSQILNSKKNALDAIFQMCQCTSGTPCQLRPTYHTVLGVNKIKDYVCDYSGNATDDTLPLETAANIEAKSVPLRYYDSEGLSHDNPTQSTPAQEGNTFKYQNNNPLKPNNNLPDSITSELVYIGFNEIYGSIDPKDSNAAKPPTVVRVTKGKQYDIYINSGTYTPCLNCGNDYYSTINKLFPSNFGFKGGGYSPSTNRTERKNSKSYNEGNYRADDLLFGRACFIPATMIPWTHSPSVTLDQQRRLRLKAQHFLFANGLQRDWYGFDYGSIIGSFDGVTWFSIGNARRVTAQTNKLFLAVNGYFGDLTINSTFSAQISEVFADYTQGNQDIITDYDTEGAECQKYHLCETDADCLTQLGYEYSCQMIGDLNTQWPYFDINGQEIPGVENSRNFINLLVGGIGSSNTSKRCVYRGRGAPCTPNYNITNADETYTQNSRAGLHACAPNYYCQVIEQNGNKIEKFNNRISRFAKSPANQNEQSFISNLSEIFGLGARTIGRPFQYNGDEAIEDEAKESLYANNVKAICLPGRDINDPDDSYLSQHSKAPTTSYLGDKVFGIGMSGPETTSFADDSLSSCAILDEDGNYLYHQSEFYNKTLTDNEIKMLAATQTFSTNLLKVFYNEGTTPFLLTEENSFLESETLQENRCLRAPGSPCFSNEECGPSSFISNKVKALTGMSSTSYNQYEFEYWSEELTCGQPYPATSLFFKLTENRCCRSTGKSLSIHSPNEINSNDLSEVPPSIDTSKVPSVDISPASTLRYSRIVPSYLAMKDSTPPDGKRQIPPLSGPKRNSCEGNSANCHAIPNLSSSSVSLRPQFMALHKIASRTCCTGNWVRNFHEDNGKGHKFSAEKMQTIPKEVFKCKAFIPTTTQKNFECPDAQFNCHAKNIATNEALAVNQFLSSLELLGIPNVLIKTSEDPLIACNVYVDPLNIIADTDDTRAPEKQPIPGTVRYVNNSTESATLPSPTAIPEYLSGSTPYFAANDPRNFDMTKGLRMIFSSNSFSCCLPAGEAYDFTFTDNDCCTGTAYTDSGTNQKRCCLPSFTNVTTYLNRYVSSEAGDLDESLFDPLTGSLPPSIVMQIAQSKKLCCSGQTSTGVAYAPYNIPGSTQTNQQRNRFLYLPTDSNAEFYDVGIRWNSDVYCVPDTN